MKPQSHNRYIIPPSKGFVLSIRLCLLLAAVAHLFASVFFQKDLATSWEGTVPHLAIALLSVVGAIAGTHGSVLFGRRGEFLPLICCVVVLVLSAGLTALSATGFYSAESRRAAKSEQAVTNAAKLDTQQIDSLRSQIAALQGGGGGEGGLSPRLIQLRQQRAELVQQRDAFAAKNIISAGVKPTQDRIDAVDGEIAVEQSSAMASQGAADKVNSDRLSALQSELSAAIAEAKQTGQAAPKHVSSADALFESLGHNWSIPAETVRARFLFWQPIILEVMSVLLSLISACLSPAGLSGDGPRPKGKNEPVWDDETPRDQVAPAPRRMQPATADAASRDVIPMETETEMETQFIKKPSLAEYVNAIFEVWTPSNPKLVGKDSAAKALNEGRPEQHQVGRSDIIRLHQRARSSPFYSVDSRKQSWAIFDPVPQDKDEAVAMFLSSL